MAWMRREKKKMREMGVMGGWLDDMWATRHMQWAADEERRESARFVSAGDPNATQI